MRRYMFGPFGCLIHFSSRVLPGLKDHGTNAVKPPNASWSSRIASRWSSRSSVSSKCPYIIVAVDLNPRRWASRWTSSQVSGPPFFGSMRWRTRAERTSAPPPGSVRCPAPQSRSSTSTTVSRLTSATVRISEAVKKCGVTCGKRRRVSRMDSIMRSRRDALALPDSHHIVERVPFDRDLAGVTDHAQELLAREASRGLGACHVLHPFVLEGAVHVVGAEVKGDRSRVLTEEHPVRLDVGEVVEQQARGGDRAEIVGGRCGPRHELRRPDLVRQRDERQEPTGGVLLGPEPEQVIDTLGQRLDVTVEHRRVRPDAE